MRITMNMGLGINQRIQVGSKVNYTDEAKALFARMPDAPSSGYKLLVDNLIKDFKNATNWERGALWGRADAIVLFSGHKSTGNALLNWKSANFNPSINGNAKLSPSGFKTGFVNTDFINFEFNPSTQASNLKLTDGAISVFSDTQTLDGYEFGSFDTNQKFTGVTTHLVAIANKTYAGLGCSLKEIGTSTEKRGLIVVTRTGTTLTVYKNKVKVADQTINAQQFANLKLWLGGYNANGTMTAPCRSRFLGYVISDALTANEITTLDNLLTAFKANSVQYYNATSKVLVCDGNSLTKGTGAVFMVSDYPHLLDLPDWSIINLGVSSQRTVTMTTNAPENVDIDYYESKNTKNVLVAWEIINDLGSVTNDQAITNFWTYCDARKAAGWKVIICTLIAHPTLQSRIDYCNPILRANYATHADAIVDLAADVRLQTCTDETYFYTDHTHLNATGYGVVASLIKPVVEAQ